MTVNVFLLVFHTRTDNQIKGQTKFRLVIYIWTNYFLLVSMSFTIVNYMAQICTDQKQRYHLIKK